MSTKEITKRSFFVAGGISPGLIAGSIAKHSRKTNIGAHQIFLGQVRADVIDGKTVKAIEFSEYREMAEQTIAALREETIVKYGLTCAHVLHSSGVVRAGEICLFVFVSSPHRKAAISACAELVERIKKEAPVFGKEIVEDDSSHWKKNTD